MLVSRWFVSKGAKLDCLKNSPCSDAWSDIENGSVEERRAPPHELAVIARVHERDSLSTNHLLRRRLVGCCSLSLRFQTLVAVSERDLSDQA